MYNTHTHTTADWDCDESNWGQLIIAWRKFCLFAHHQLSLGRAEKEKLLAVVGGRQLLPGGIGLVLFSQCMLNVHTPCSWALQTTPIALQHFTSWIVFYTLGLSVSVAQWSRVFSSLEVIGSVIHVDVSETWRETQRPSRGVLRLLLCCSRRLTRILDFRFPLGLCTCPQCQNYQQVDCWLRFPCAWLFSPLNPGWAAARMKLKPTYQQYRRAEGCVQSNLLNLTTGASLTLLLVEVLKIWYFWVWWWAQLQFVLHVSETILLCFYLRDKQIEMTEK